VSIAIEILIVLLLVALNGVFALAELAIVSSRRARLEAMRRKRAKGAEAALELQADPERFLPTVQVGITLVGVLAGAFGGARLSERLGGYLDTLPGIEPNGVAIAFGIVVVIITYLSLILGELVPKRVALLRPEAIAVIMAQPMRTLSRITAPVVWFLGASTTLVLRLIGAKPPTDSAVTEEEVKAMIQEGTASGVFAEEERAMLERVLRMADRPVRAIMTPRLEVGWVDRNDTPQNLAAQLRSKPYSHFVVGDGSIDQVAGVVRAKDMLDQILEGEPFDLGKVLRQPVVLPDSISVLAAVKRMKQDPIGFALVVDEYGSLEGVVSPSDVLEAIVGELADATVENAPGVASREDGSLLMDGMLSVDELQRQLGLEALPGDGGYHTLAGFLLALLKRVPREGDAVSWQGWRFEVVDMDSRRVDKVIAKREADVTPDL